MTKSFILYRIPSLLISLCRQSWQKFVPRKWMRRTLNSTRFGNNVHLPYQYEFQRHFALVPTQLCYPFLQTQIPVEREKRIRRNVTEKMGGKWFHVNLAKKRPVFYLGWSCFILLGTIRYVPHLTLQFLKRMAKGNHIKQRKSSWN